MSMPMADLLLHPIRLRIVTAMTSGNQTPKELAQTLQDIPQTTLYRQINILIDGGFLQVVDEIPQRGTVERVLGLNVSPSLNQKDLAGLSKEEYQQTFMIIMTSLLQEAINSLSNLPADEEIDLLGAGYQFNQIQLNLSDEEYQRLNHEISALMLSAAQNKPADTRRRRIFSYLFVPVIPADQEIE